MVIHPEGAVETLPEAPGLDVSRQGDAIFVQYRSQDTSAEDVLGAVRAAGIRIRDVKTQEADLEDVFLSLTRSRAAL